MPFPSRIQGSGQSGGAATAIAGDVTTAITTAGTTAATATALSAVYNQLTVVVSGAAGAMLPTCETGALVVVANDDAGDTATIYPQTGTTIDGQASVTIALAKRRIFIGLSPTAWVSILGA